MSETPRFTVYQDYDHGDEIIDTQRGGEEVEHDKIARILNAVDRYVKAYKAQEEFEEANNLPCQGREDITEIEEAMK